MTGDHRNWQFSLRAMFGLTTICALLLSLNARHPGTIWVLGALLLIGVGILALQLVWVGVPVGVTVVGEMAIAKILRWLRGPSAAAPPKGFKGTSDT